MSKELEAIFKKHFIKEMINKDFDSLKKTHPTLFRCVMNSMKEASSINKKIKEKKPFVPPTLEEVKKYFKENGYSDESATRAFEHYVTGDWRDSDGRPVVIWKQKMRTNWFKEKNKIGFNSNSQFGNNYPSNQFPSSNPTVYSGSFFDKEKPNNHIANEFGRE